MYEPCISDYISNVSDYCDIATYDPETNIPPRRTEINAVNAISDPSLGLTEGCKVSTRPYDSKYIF